MTGMSEDITSTEGSTDVLESGMSHVETLAQICPMGIFRTDAQGNLRYVSKRWREIAEMPQANVTMNGWLEAIHPGDRARVGAAWSAAVAAWQPFDMKCRFQVSGQTTLWVRVQAVAERDHSGELAGYIGTITDITEQKKSEVALLAREAEFQTLVQNIPGTVYRCAFDEHWTITFLSDHIETLSGYPLTDFIDNRVRSYASIIHPDDRTKVYQGVSEAVSRHTPYSLEYRIIHADSKPRWVLEKGQATFDEHGEVAWLDGVIADITERKHAEEEVRQNSEKLEALLNLSQEFASLDLGKVLQTTTDRVTELSEFESAAVYLLEGDILHLWATTPPLPPDFPDDLYNAPLADHPHIRRAIETRQPVFLANTATTLLTPAEQRVSKIRRLRSILYLPLLTRTQALGTLIVTSSGKPLRISEVQTDLCLTLANMAALAVENARLYQSSQQYALVLEQKVDECMTAEKALRESESRYRHMFQANPHPMWVFDRKTLRFLAVNDAAVDHYGYSPDEFLAMTIEDIRPSEDLPRLHENLGNPINSGIDNAGVWRHIKKDGSLIDVIITSHCMKFDGHDAELVLAYDVTERKQAQERIQQLAHFDSLTGLPNRALFNDRLNQAISQASRNQQSLVLIFIDLDHFKHINDTLGHRIGDQLLIEVAKRLQASIREEDTVSRFGGDEFILLLPETDADGAARVAEKLVQTISRHYQIEQHELVVTPSIGIALFPSDGDDFNTLFMSADIAMYRAKRDGRNNYSFFTGEMQARSRRKLQLRNALLRSLERNQLQLQYQPQVSLDSGRIVGAEALLRWQHPELGSISPSEFIPLAEDSGAIVAIGEWVLRNATRQLNTWMENGLPSIVIAVNLSAVQFRQPQLPERISQILHEEGVSPKFLELELTESVAMDNPVHAVAVMNELHRRNVNMSIDDFGTGHSSLSYLKRFQVRRLKIAHSFIRDIATKPDDLAIVSAVISLAKGLGIRTLAEGVETKEQLELLRKQGCDDIQGFYYATPLPADRFEAFVRNKI